MANKNWFSTYNIVHNWTPPQFGYQFILKNNKGKYIIPILFNNDVWDEKVISINKLYQIDEKSPHAFNPIGYMTNKEKQKLTGVLLLNGSNGLKDFINRPQKKFYLGKFVVIDKNEATQNLDDSFNVKLVRLVEVIDPEKVKNIANVYPFNVMLDKNKWDGPVPLDIWKLLITDLVKQSQFSKLFYIDETKILNNVYRNIILENIKSIDKKQLLEIKFRNIVPTQYNKLLNSIKVDKDSLKELIYENTNDIDKLNNIFNNLKNADLNILYELASDINFINDIYKMNSHLALILLELVVSNVNYATDELIKLYITYKYDNEDDLMVIINNLIAKVKETATDNSYLNKENALKNKRYLELLPNLISYAMRNDLCREIEKVKHELLTDINVDRLNEIAEYALNKFTSPIVVNLIISHKNCNKDIINKFCHSHYVNSLSVVSQLLLQGEKFDKECNFVTQIIKKTTNPQVIDLLLSKYIFDAPIYKKLIKNGFANLIIKNEDEVEDNILKMAINNLIYQAEKDPKKIKYVVDTISNVKELISGNAKQRLIKLIIKHYNLPISNILLTKLNINIFQEEEENSVPVDRVIK